MSTNEMIPLIKPCQNSQSYDGPLKAINKGTVNNRNIVWSDYTLANDNNRYNPKLNVSSNKPPDKKPLKNRKISIYVKTLKNEAWIPLNGFTRILFRIGLSMS